VTPHLAQARRSDDGAGRRRLGAGSELAAR
jgi:hypothetical protein